MTAKLILNPLNEEQELQERREELSLLEAQLVGCESESANLQTELRAFERKYLSIVGPLYDELAAIEKKIAEIQGLGFEDFDGADSLADDAVGCGLNRLHSEKLKKLYREVARKFHPDLAQCEQERHRRHQLMVEVNRAYETGAEDRLQALLEAGVSIEEGVNNRAISAEMLMLVRRIAEAKERLIELESGIGEMMASETYKLKLRVENAEAIGVDLFADLIAQVERQINKARNRFEHLQSVVMVE